MGHTNRPGTQSNTLVLYHTVTDWEVAASVCTGQDWEMLNIAPGSGRWPRKGPAPRAIPVTSCYSHPDVLVQLWPLGTHALLPNWKHPRLTIHSSWDVCRPWNTETETTTIITTPSWVGIAQDRSRPPQGPRGLPPSSHDHDREPWQDGCHMLPPVPQ